MFALVSTLAKIEKGLKPVNRATFIGSFRDEISSAKHVVEAMVQDKDLPVYLRPAVVSALDTLDSASRAVWVTRPAAIPEAYSQLESVMLHAYRLGNALDGHNCANVAMYSLLLQFKAQTLLDLITSAATLEDRKDA